MTARTRQEAEDAILERVDSLMHSLAGRRAPEFLGLDITMAQAKCLYVVSLQPGIGMSSLARALHTGLSATSGLVDRLVEQGYLSRHEDAADRRQQLLSLTTAGQGTLDRIRELNSAHLRTLLAGLSPHELESLLEGITALGREAVRRAQLDSAIDPRGSERNPA